MAGVRARMEKWAPGLLEEHVRYSETTRQVGSEDVNDKGPSPSVEVGRVSLIFLKALSTWPTGPWIQK